MKNCKGYLARVSSEQGLAALSLTVMAGVLALLMVASVQKQVMVFSRSLVRARLLTEAQFASEALSLRLREAYLLASRKPEGVAQAAAPFYASYKSGPAADFHLVKSTGGATDLYIYSVGNQFCFNRPTNSTFGILTDPICVNIPADILVQRKSDQLTPKDYYVFFMHKVYELTTTPDAVAQVNPSDPGTAGLTAASYDLAPALADPNFVADYDDQKCNNTNGNVDCFRFRFCLRTTQADCAAGVGNERYAIQTIILNKTPSTTMGD